MSELGGSRPLDKIVGDLLDAAEAAAEIVARGHEAWSRDRVLRLAGEAVINRIGDAAGKLPDEVRSAMPNVPWDAIRANRILVAHIYHRIDPEILWATLSRDVPSLGVEVRQWHALARAPENDLGRDTGLGLGF